MRFVLFVEGYTEKKRIAKGDDLPSIWKLLPTGRRRGPWLSDLCTIQGHESCEAVWISFLPFGSRIFLPGGPCRITAADFVRCLAS